MIKYLQPFKIIAFSALAFVLEYSQLSAVSMPGEADVTAQKKLGDSAKFNICITNNTGFPYHFDIKYTDSTGDNPDPSAPESEHHCNQDAIKTMVFPAWGFS